MRPRVVVAGMALTAMIVVLGALWVTRPDAAGTGSPPLVQPGPTDLYGVFEGRIPCVDCERVKVRLTLSTDDAAPTDYVLELIHVGQGDARQVSEGSWRIESGAAADSDAATYVLDEHAPEGYRHYLAVGDDILLFLDAAGRLVVGDAGHSFTLSRTG
jgi:hypothetical protein